MANNLPKDEDRLVGSEIHGFHTFKDLDVATMMEEAKSRWLDINKIYAILCNINYKYFEIQEKQVQLPKGGTILFFDRKKLKNDPYDDYNWQKSKDGKFVKLTSRDLTVGNKKRIRGHIVRGEDSSTFVRRCYWLLDKSLECIDTDIVLVHYLEEQEDSNAAPVVLCPPKRPPECGKSGEKCLVKANHLLIEFPKDLIIHCYLVTMRPDPPSNLLIGYFIKNHVRTGFYNGHKILYNPLAVAPKFLRPYAFQFNLGEKTSHFNVTLKLVSRLRVPQKFICNQKMDLLPEVTRALNNLLRVSLNERPFALGKSRSHFFSANLGLGTMGLTPGRGGIEFLPGFKQSVRPTQGGLSLNFDITTTGFYEGIEVMDFLDKYCPQIPQPQRYQNAGKILMGIKVELTHLGHVYKITGISSQPLQELMFTDSEGKRKSVVEYFKKRYDIEFKQTSLPALQSGNNKENPIYLPMELCKIVKGQRFTHQPFKINEVQGLEDFLSEKGKNTRAIAASMSTVYNRNKVVNEFGIQVKGELTPVHARILSTPKLQYHFDSGMVKPEDDGTWSMYQKKMFKPGKVKYWTCLCFSKDVGERVQNSFCQALAEMCRNLGMEFENNPVIPITKSVDLARDEALVKVNKEVKKSCQDNLQLLIVILPDARGDYGVIKRVCETELGIVTQCCQPKKVVDCVEGHVERDSILRSLALKINVKVGGLNNVLCDAIEKGIPCVSSEPTIIFGADVTHPTAKDGIDISIAAVVASTDWPEITNYGGTISKNHRLEEIIKDLYTYDGSHGGMIRELLLSFYKSNNQLKPKNIIFYRDGIGEKRFGEVLNKEVTAIRKACNSFQDYCPKITFVVVQKGHHTSLFPEGEDGKIRPGIVVDTEVCHPTEFDFYLNSHSSLKEHVQPTHYHVLYDENAFTSDDLQVLTNNLCYTNAKNTESLSIVAPVHYAHLLAYRARFYMKDTGDQDLPMIRDEVKKVMFFC